MKSKFTISIVLFSICINYHIISQDLSKKLLHANYENWNLQNEINFYNPDNLYDYIDGAADNYLSFGFDSLMSAVYSLDSSNYIKVDIYKHQNSNCAFGIYLTERPQNFKILNIGIQGYSEHGFVNFYKSNFYVKINTHSEYKEIDTIVYKIGKVISDKIENNNVSSVINNFPEQNKIPNSERYIHSNFLGHEFLNNAFTCDYYIKKSTITLFIIDCNSEKIADNVLSNFCSYANQKCKNNSETIELSDPHLGKIELRKKSNYVIGIINRNNAKIKVDYLQLITDSLK